MIPVSLSWHEFAIAAHVGQLRTLEAIRRAQKRHDGTSPTMDEEIEGAAAEMAVAKALNLYWDGSVNNLDGADVGNLHVRHTTYKNGSLIVRPRDIDKHGPLAVFVLVTGKRGNYIVKGQMTAGEAAQDEYARDPGGKGVAWFVPASALSPVDVAVPA